MRIALLSNLIEPSLFETLNNQKKAGNPSGQNFYDRLYRSLEKIGDLTIYSLVPDTVKEETQGQRFHYFYHDKGKLSLFKDAHNIAKTIIEDHESSPIDVLLYNSLSLTLAKAATIIAKKTNIKVICVATDDPTNISFTPFYYATLCRSFNKKANAYFCLTDGLNRIFNKSNKPFYIQMGIVEEAKETTSPQEKPYLYFGGALFEKDGVNDLIKAYIAAAPNADLYIAGHGPLAEEIASRNEKGLHFLGQISKDEHLRYISGAEVVFNPRRYRAALDDVSVPSKVLEYLSTSKACLSTLSTPIKKAYDEDMNWLETSEDNEQEIKKFLLDHMDENGNLIHLKANHAKQKIQKELGIDATASNLKKFFSDLL